MESFFHPFPVFFGNVVSVCHPINVTHMGFIVFDDQKLHSFLTFLEVTSVGGMCILERI
jgi:hypothetical protein